MMPTNIMFFHYFDAFGILHKVCNMKAGDMFSDYRGVEYEVQANLSVRRISPKRDANGNYIRYN